MSERIALRNTMYGSDELHIEFYLGIGIGCNPNAQIRHFGTRDARGGRSGRLPQPPTFLVLEVVRHHGGDQQGPPAGFASQEAEQRVHKLEREVSAAEEQASATGGGDALRIPDRMLQGRAQAAIVLDEGERQVDELGAARVAHTEDPAAHVNVAIHEVPAQHAHERPVGSTRHLAVQHR
eukprot:scaffold8405_cov117-Isochrysis_galbana.AAC.4